MSALSERLAHVPAVRAGELVGVRLHEVAQPVQQLLAGAIPHPRPGSVVEGTAGGGDGEGRPRPGDGEVRLRPAAECDLSPGLAGPRVDRLETSTIGRLDFLAVDDVAEERGFTHDGPAFLSSWGGDSVFGLLAGRATS